MITNKKLFIIIFLSTLLIGCGGLADIDIKHAEKLQREIQQMPKTITQQQTSIKNLLSSEQNSDQKTETASFFTTYAKKENWLDFFTQAQKQLKNTEHSFNQNIAPILEENNDDDTSKLKASIKVLEIQLVKIKKLALKANQRKNIIRHAKENIKHIVLESNQKIEKIDQLLTTAKMLAQESKQKHPHQIKVINLRIEKLSQQQQLSHQSLSTLISENNKLKSKSIDYADFADSAINITHIQTKLDLAVPKLKTSLTQLDRSYSKVLVDMRIDYYVQISRTSWDDYSDYPTEHIHIFTSQVDKKVADFFDKTTTAIATINKYKQLNLRAPKSYWQTLKISPTSSWSSGDNTAEFWVSNIVYKYFHQTIINENKKQSKPTWQAVSEPYFWKNESNLGMALLSKPYGLFEDESITQAAPPGMDTIATPAVENGKAVGSNQYGEWRQDNTGLSFWHYYAAYSFMRMLMPNRSPYYYSDWNHYNSRDRNKPYYGNGRYGTYGNSTYNNSRYKNSSYSRKNPNLRTKSGRTKQRSENTRRKNAASVRSSGPKTRSRGPSRGGK